jgi:hypothetical protein
VADGEAVSVAVSVAAVLVSSSGHESSSVEVLVAASPLVVEVVPGASVMVELSVAV